MQDKLIEAAQEVEGPFIVESEGIGCDKCGAGEFWNVVFKPEDVALSTAYGDKEEAEDLAEDLNNAFRKGVSSVRAHDAGTVSTAQLDAEDQHPKMRAEPVEDVVSRMCKAFKCSEEIWRQEMTAAFAVAREGYYSLEAVEKAIQKEINRYHESAAIHLYDDLVPNILAHLAPKPEPTLAEEIDKILLKHNIRTVTSENVVCNSAVSAELAALVERREGK